MNFDKTRCQMDNMMHEFSVVRTLLKQVDDVARRHGGEICEIHVSIGEFSGIDVDLLQSAFEQLASESPARGASLKVQRTELQARCEVCETIFAVQGFRFVCPHCHGTNARIVRGEELLLEKVLLETTP